MPLPIKIASGKPLKEISTLQIGGAARFFTVVKTSHEAVKALLFSKKYKVPFLVVGKGSNCLFDDRGFSGLVILNKIDYWDLSSNIVKVGSGFNFSLLGARVSKKGLTGLEFASGIPATVGGAVFMNAGANGQETFDTLKKVTFLTEEGKLMQFSKDELQYSYRFSSFQKMQGMIIEATFELSNSLQAKEMQNAIVSYRRKTQPYNEKSAGCIFRNPNDASAAQLIDQSNLKGTAVGGACVSLKHANFLINKNNASAKDMKMLIEKVKKQVEGKTGIKLQEEIRFIPYE
ncbi:MAG: UDP-N-acetylmuramate dehydrogenase [Chlamydiota bacterium]